MMARKLTISNEHIEATIAPENGGMLISLKVDGIETLRLNESDLQSTPMKAGGCPVMFPFPSKTMNDTYTVSENRSYGMPFHGLLKNSAFGIKNVTNDEVILFMTNSEACLASQYPYPYRLELKYQLIDDGIRLIASVENTGDEPLYHGFGWHPFFKSCDKKAVRLSHTYTVNYDYVEHCDKINNLVMDDLSLPWDHVLHTPTSNTFEIINSKEGYQVNCEVDEHFQVLVVCTTTENAVCVEPWCGIPNTANSKRFAQYVEPGKCEDYTFTMHLKTV